MRRALDALLRSGRPFDVISVVDPATVDELSDGVQSLLDLGVDRLTLNPNWGAAWSDERRAVWRAQYEIVGAVVVAWFRRGRPVVVQPFDSALVGLSRGQTSTHACGAGVTRFAVSPSGRIYGCARAVGEDRGDRALGHLDTGVDAQRLVREGAPACAGACSCACAEETGRADQQGETHAWHEGMVLALARRIARVLGGTDAFRTAFAEEA